MMISIIDKVKDKFAELVSSRKLGQEEVNVVVKTLTPKEAIGSPERQDYPILIGKEVIVEAQFEDCYGQAFTDTPQSFSGTLDDLLALELNTNSNRAVFIASINAVTAKLDIADRVRHCRDEEPEDCAKKIAADFKERFGDAKIGLIGLQPAMLENLCREFGAANVRCTDMNPKNINTKKFGAEIWDGGTQTGEIIDWADVLLVTSSTLSNGSLDNILEQAEKEGKHIILFGITGAAVCALTGIERVCHLGH